MVSPWVQTVPNSWQIFLYSYEVKFLRSMKETKEKVAKALI